MEDNMETLVERARKYIERARNNPGDTDIPLYSLNEEGTFKILGGIRLPVGKDRFKLEHDIVKGRFVDALFYALRLDGFYGVLMDRNNIGSDLHGYIIKLNPIEVENAPEIFRNSLLDRL